MIQQRQNPAKHFDISGWNLSPQILVLEKSLNGRAASTAAGAAAIQGHFVPGEGHPMQPAVLWVASGREGAAGTAEWRAAHPQELGKAMPSLPRGAPGRGVSPAEQGRLDARARSV